jgi:hypothetical protein
MIIVAGRGVKCGIVTDYGFDVEHFYVQVGLVLTSHGFELSAPPPPNKATKLEKALLFLV